MSGSVPTDRMRFRHSWRPYQKRVLDVVDRHLSDDRLHIVAAPGAGKTTLGLEVFRRLGRPGLVLTPSLTIRRQWIRRLDDFLAPADRDPASMSAWTSTDLRRPAFLTVATYQAVLARVREDADALDGASEEIAEDPGSEADFPPAPSDDDVATIVATLRDAGVRTLLLDEAHHLKRAWWKALTEVVDALDHVTLVSLTGTPPYDATGLEWRRYEELCGPIDDEISAPELVRAGTLCPHQDFVWVVEPAPAEAEAIREHDDAVAEELDGLLGDAAFQAAVDAHPWVGSGAPDAGAVLDEPELAVALLIYLRATGAALPTGLPAMLGLRDEDLPAISRRWWEVLLRAYLFGGTFSEDDPYRAVLARRLRERGLLWRRTLRIAASGTAERGLALSGAKIEACARIHEVERAERGAALRQVVLTDYIRDESLDAESGAADPDLGAWPVFDALTAPGREAVGGGGPARAHVRAATAHADGTAWRSDVALVSGRLTVVHESVADDLGRELGARAPALRPLPREGGWLRVTGVPSGVLVAALTRLLTRGTLRTLVGTRALLGEGWDAPAVNSLVLASSIGATVGTNQMRGRAIRTDRAAPDKVASVWHLAAVAGDTPTGFLDWERLSERFRTFVGISADGTAIESGIERLCLEPPATGADVEGFNAESVRRLGELGRVSEGWRAAIGTAEVGRVVPTVSFHDPPSLRPYHVANSLRWVLVETGLATLVAVGEVMRQLVGSGQLGVLVMVAAALPMVTLAPRLGRAARLVLAHAPYGGSVGRIGEALLETLAEVGLLEGDDLTVRVRTFMDGTVHLSLEGGTFHDQSVFADAVGELLGPIENSRYLITRPTVGLLGRRVDYHAVPRALGARRKEADQLLAAWRRRVGPGELIYTRREGGREALLEARSRAFANQFVDPAERIDRWQ